ncbi:hypothetical protein GCM10029976_060630 [Kribbella albertanoniae]|uniref:Uncharacterized protein n=1 Tax=Kribbella albertanoniae TaxID=1266829 RepID=A0A4R4Q3Z9_9ACTN|nr:DUF5324 family protein [Kribbella albertanoniae]TDC29592.1 hypothetical protein E1261_15365 [Kribbella albertanoniae]
MGLRKSKGRIDIAKDRVRPFAESASEKLGPAVGTAREKVSPYAEKAVERGAHLAHVAVEKAGPRIDDALSKVGPATEHAAEKARERFNDDVLPKVSAALASLAAAAEPVVEETSRRGKATKAALRGEVDVPKKSHKLRTAVLLLGLGALAAAAVKKLLTPPEPAWQSTPTSGRDYSSAAAPRSESSNGHTTAKTETPKPEAPKAETPKADEVKAKTEAAKADEAKPEVKASSNGAAKKTTTTRKSTDTKPSDS